MTPSVEDICQRMQKERETESDIRFFGPAYIKVTHMVEIWHNGKVVDKVYDEVVLTVLRWDHTGWSIQEAVDMAKRGEGKVYVGQDVYDCGETEEEDSDPLDPPGMFWINEGYELEVWPTWTGEVS